MKAIIKVTLCMLLISFSLNASAEYYMNYLEAGSQADERYYQPRITQHNHHQIHRVIHHRHAHSKYVKPRAYTSSRNSDSFYPDMSTWDDNPLTHPDLQLN